MNAAKFMMIVLAGTILLICTAFAVAHLICYFTLLSGGCLQ